MTPPTRDEIDRLTAAAGFAPSDIAIDWLTVRMFEIGATYEERRRRTVPWRECVENVERIGASVRRLKSDIAKASRFDAKHNLSRHTSAELGMSTEWIDGLDQILTRAQSYKNDLLCNDETTSSFLPPDVALIGRDLPRVFDGAFGRLRRRSKAGDGMSARVRFIMAALELFGLPPRSPSTIQQYIARMRDAPEYDGTEDPLGPAGSGEPP